jgi:uncharacterized protein
MEKEDISFPFIGKGWKFPIEFERAEKGKGVKMLGGEDDIKSSLDVLFATKAGERVMRPDYGSELHHLLFMPMNTGMKTYMTTLIKNAILFHEPRIKTDLVEIEESPNEQGKLEIKITYTILVTNSRYNYVFPFYKNEGTNLVR